MQFSKKNIFLFDSIGAFITSMLLSQVLTRFETYFGMPSQILWVLATTAFCFSIYGIFCHFFAKNQPDVFLKIIMLANSLYCISIAILMVIYVDYLKWLGIGYFMGEILIIAILVLIEYKVLINAKATELT